MNELLNDSIKQLTQKVAETWDQVWDLDDVGAAELLDGFLDGRISFRITLTGVEILEAVTDASP